MGFIVWLDNQGRRHMPAFCHQDIIGAAGGCRSHAFDTDSGFYKLMADARVQESMRTAGAEQDDFRLEGNELAEMFGSQAVETLYIPVLNQDGRQHDNAAAVFCMIDFYPVVTIAGN